MSLECGLSLSILGPRISTREQSSRLVYEYLPKIFALLEGSDVCAMLYRESMDAAILRSCGRLTVVFVVSRVTAVDS